MTRAFLLISILTLFAFLFIEGTAQVHLVTSRTIEARESHR
jgi:hypothetical protein